MNCHMVTLQLPASGSREIRQWLLRYGVEVPADTDILLFFCVQVCPCVSKGAIFTDLSLEERANPASAQPPKGCLEVPLGDPLV